MCWVAENEEKIRDIIDSNCHVVGKLTNWRGQHCFWGGYLTKYEGYKSKIFQNGLFHKNGKIVINPTEGYNLYYIPFRFRCEMMIVNDAYQNLAERRAALHQVVDEWLEIEAQEN